MPFNSLTPNPLENVRRTIAQLNILILAIAQEPNGLQIDKMYFGQIEDHGARSILNALPKFLNTPGADPPDQAQNHPSPVGFYFNSKHEDARYFSRHLSRYAICVPGKKRGGGGQTKELRPRCCRV